MERFGANNVTKFSVDAPATPIWQFSTEGMTESNSNPYNIVFVNSTKAYLIRYGSPKVWIINPSATVESEFKIGELDLSAYSNCDGNPEMANGIIVDGKLFIVMQRLCNWVPNASAYIAVFDVNTDTEINTGQGGSLKGIKLDVSNPVAKLKYYNNYIYVAGADGTLFGANNPIIGGIQKINTTTYVADPNIIEGHTQITGLEILSDTKGYFIQYQAWANNSLKTFNPQTGVVTPGNVANIGDTGDENLQDIIIDADGLLWLADGSLIDPGVYIIDPATDTIQEGPIFTNLNPLEISFCEK